MSPTRGVLYFGGAGSLSTAALRELHAAGIGIDAVVCFGFGGAPEPVSTPFPVSLPPHRDAFVQVAEQLAIPQLHVSDLHVLESREQLQALRPDVLLSVCFPRRLPDWLQTLPAKACLNLHPSMLPAYRGPAPLFWQFRNGEPNLGVTVHRVSDELDAGPILAQRRVALCDGLRHAEITRKLARVGAQLFMAALPAIAAGAASYSAQDERAQSYQPAPQAADFALDPQWSARHAFNFMRATEHYCHPYSFTDDGKTRLLARAAAFSDAREASRGLPDDGTIALAFRRGTLYAHPQ